MFKEVSFGSIGQTNIENEPVALDLDTKIKLSEYLKLNNNINEWRRNVKN